MKRYLNFLVAIFLAGCSPHPNEIITKKWEQVALIDTAAIDPCILLKAQSLEFFTGERWAVNGGHAPSDTGRFILDQENKTLRLIVRDSAVEFSVRELKWNRMVLEKNSALFVYHPVR